jgi:LysR family transcriptional regulator, benzoate and cis,cis-muconate-responsive activator of ben and cat genes
MELRHLRYFMAVATEGNIGRAARRLNVSQPALTKQIRELEREIGVQLFDRTPRGVQLTTAGKAFAIGAEASIASAHHAGQWARAAERDVVGRLAIGYIRPDAHVEILSPILRALHERYPSLELSLSYMSSSDQWRALRDWQLDVGLAYCSPPAAMNLASEQLQDSSLTGVLVADDHPLATAPSVRLSELGSFPFLIFRRELNPGAYDQIVDSLTARGITPVAIQEGVSMSLNVTTRPRDHAWTLSNHALASRDVPARTVFRPFEDDPIPFWLSLVWRRHDESPLVPLFLALAREVRDGIEPRVQPVAGTADQRSVSPNAI